jgi:hypothetical protein
MSSVYKGAGKFNLHVSQDETHELLPQNHLREKRIPEDKKDKHMIFFKNPAAYL